MTGKSPRTPSVVLRACKSKPAGHTQGNFLGLPHVRAPVRLLPIRAPRQAVLRTSSRLAPSFANRSCNLPEKKTLDASNRLLPPNRTACTRTLSVPSSSRHFRGGDTPRRIRLHAVVDWGTGCFTTSANASADRHSERRPRVPLPHGLESRAWGCYSHGADATEPLTPLSPSRFHPHASLTFARAAT